MKTMEERMEERIEEMTVSEFIKEHGIEEVDISSQFNLNKLGEYFSFEDCRICKFGDDPIKTINDEIDFYAKYYWDEAEERMKEYEGNYTEPDEIEVNIFGEDGEEKNIHIEGSYIHGDYVE